MADSMKSKDIIMADSMKSKDPTSRNVLFITQPTLGGGGLVGGCSGWVKVKHSPNSGLVELCNV